MKLNPEKFLSHVAVVDGITITSFSNLDNRGNVFCSWTHTVMSANVILSSFTFEISDLSFFGNGYALSEEASHHCDHENQQQSDYITHGDPFC